MLEIWETILVCFNLIISTIETPGIFHLWESELKICRYPTFPENCKFNITEDLCVWYMKTPLNLLQQLY